MSPEELQRLLESHNIGFKTKEMPYGRQFRLDDGAIANCYNSGKVVWQGKETETVSKIRGLYGDKPAEASGGAGKSGETINLSNNKVFIVYGHDIEAREQLESLLRRMKLEPVILQEFSIGGDTMIEKLEANIDVRYACVLLTPDDEGYPFGSSKRKNHALVRM